MHDELIICDFKANESTMPSSQTAIPYETVIQTQRYFVGNLLTLCIIITSLGSIAIIISSFTHINVKGVPVVKVVGGVFLIIGTSLSIAFGITLLRMPSFPESNNSSRVTTVQSSHCQRPQTDVCLVLNDITRTSVSSIPVHGNTESLPYSSMRFIAPPSYEEATRQ